MEKIRDLIQTNLAWLVESGDFHVQNERLNDFEYSVEYSSRYFTLHLVTYHHEIYVMLSRKEQSVGEVDLYNLLRYQAGNMKGEPIYNYYHDEADTYIRYSRQVVTLSVLLRDQLSKLIDFFSRCNVSEQLDDLRQKMIEAYPELFRHR